MSHKSPKACNVYRIRNAVLIGDCSPPARMLHIIHTLNKFLILFPRYLNGWNTVWRETRLHSKKWVRTTTNFIKMQFGKGPIQWPFTDSDIIALWLWALFFLPLSTITILCAYGQVYSHSYTYISILCQPFHPCFHVYHIICILFIKFTQTSLLITFTKWLIFHLKVKILWTATNWFYTGVACDLV